MVAVFSKIEMIVSVGLTTGHALTAFSGHEFGIVSWLFLAVARRTNSGTDTVPIISFCGLYEAV